jgi:uncharacterized protein YbaP (TraB family)
MLDRRNREMADTLVSRLNSGERPFVAVGAGHLAGLPGCWQSWLGGAIS